MGTEYAFACVEEHTLTREQFFEWIIALPQVSIRTTLAKDTQTNEYFAYEHRIAVKVNQFSRKGIVLRTEKTVYPEACKKALHAGILPVFNLL